MDPQQLHLNMVRIWRFQPQVTHRYSSSKTLLTNLHLVLGIEQARNLHETMLTFPKPHLHCGQLLCQPFCGSRRGTLKRGAWGQQVQLVGQSCFPHLGRLGPALGNLDLDGTCSACPRSLRTSSDPA